MRTLLRSRGAHAVFATAALALALQAPALAEPLTPDVQRFALQSHAGVYSSQSYAAYQLSYRLPLMDDRLDLLVGQSVLMEAASNSRLSLFELGARYYYGELTAPLRPFARASLGTLTSTSGGLTRPASQRDMPVMLAGLGVDWMPLASMGVTAGFSVGFPMLFRPELGVKLNF